MNDREISAAIQKIERMIRKDTSTSTRTDNEIKDLLRDAITWVWNAESKLQEMADLADEIDRLEAMHDVISSSPILLKELAERLRAEYEGKLERFFKLHNDSGVKSNLAELRTLTQKLREFK